MSGMESYTVKQGDTLGGIALRFLGTETRWKEIVIKNPQLAMRKRMADGSPAIVPGDILVFSRENPGVVGSSYSGAGPAAASAPGQSVALDQSAPRDISVTVGGREFTGFTAYTLSLPPDSFDAFSFSSVWDASRAECRKAFGAFSYADCAVKMGGEVVFSGTLLPASPSISENSRTISIQGYPKCGVLGDSCLPPTAFPAEFRGLSISQIARKCAEPFGVGVKVEGDEGGPFGEGVALSPSETVLSFLEKLARQRGLVISNTPSGELLLYSPVEESPSASFREGVPPFLSCRAQFDGQKMFSHVVGMAPAGGRKDEKSASFTYENKFLTSRGILRVHCETIEDARAGTIEGATKALAARMFASSARWSLSVAGHRDARGRLYRKNQTVTVTAPDAEIYRETRLVVDEVTFRRGDSEGEVAELSLVLPGVRSGTLPESFPWEE